MYLVIDNYDSFTYNLVHFLGELGAETEVWRNDAITVDQVVEKRPRGIVISPGPANRTARPPAAAARPSTDHTPRPTRPPAAPPCLLRFDELFLKLGLSRGHLPPGYPNPGYIGGGARLPGRIVRQTEHRRRFQGPGNIAITGSSILATQSRNPI